MGSKLHNNLPTNGNSNYSLNYCSISIIYIVKQYLSFSFFAYLSFDRKTFNLVPKIKIFSSSLSINLVIVKKGNYIPILVSTVKLILCFLSDCGIKPSVFQLSSTAHEKLILSSPVSLVARFFHHIKKYLKKQKFFLCDYSITKVYKINSLNLDGFRNSRFKLQEYSFLPDSLDLFSNFVYIKMPYFNFSNKLCIISLGKILSPSVLFFKSANRVMEEYLRVVRLVLQFNFCFNFKLVSNNYSADHSLNYCSIRISYAVMQCSNFSYASLACKEICQVLKITVSSYASHTKMVKKVKGKCILNYVFACKLTFCFYSKHVANNSSEFRLSAFMLYNTVYLNYYNLKMITRQIYLINPKLSSCTLPVDMYSGCIKKHVKKLKFSNCEYLNNKINLLSLTNFSNSQLKTRENLLLSNLSISNCVIVFTKLFRIYLLSKVCITIDFESIPVLILSHLLVLFAVTELNCCFSFPTPCRCIDFSATFQLPTAFSLCTGRATNHLVLTEMNCGSRSRIIFYHSRYTTGSFIEFRNSVFIMISSTAPYHLADTLNLQNLHNRYSNLPFRISIVPSFQATLTFNPPLNKFNVYFRVQLQYLVMNFSATADTEPTATYSFSNKLYSSLKIYPTLLSQISVKKSVDYLFILSCKKIKRKIKSKKHNYGMTSSNYKNNKANNPAQAIKIKLKLGVNKKLHHSLFSLLNFVLFSGFSTIQLVGFLIGSYMWSQLLFVAGNFFSVKQKAVIISSFLHFGVGDTLIISRHG